MYQIATLKPPTWSHFFKSFDIYVGFPEQLCCSNTTAKGLNILIISTFEMNSRATTDRSIFSRDHLIYDIVWSQNINKVIPLYNKDSKIMF